MGSSPDVRPTVLVVDDEVDVADAYAMQLRDSYEPIVAYGGEEALDSVDETVDAVLLDRRMPDKHGDDVLAELRARGFEFPIIMVTAVDPDLNILEMDFDDYLCKPVDKETLCSVLDQHVEAGPDDARIDEFFQILSKIEVLADQKTEAELGRSEEFTTLARRAEEMADELREQVDDFDELVATYRNVGRGSSDTGSRDLV